MLSLFSSSGTSDLTTLGNGQQSPEDSSAIRLLHHIYNYSEINLLHSYLNSEEAWIVLKTNAIKGELGDSVQVIEKSGDGLKTHEDAGSNTHGNGGGSLENGIVSIEEKLETLVLSRDSNSQEETSVTIKKESFYAPPQSCSDLLSVVNYHLDHLDKDYKVLQDMIGFSSKIPNGMEKLLEEIILKLNERGEFEEEEIIKLSQSLSKFPKESTPI